MLTQFVNRSYKQYSKKNVTEIHFHSTITATIYLAAVTIILMIFNVTDRWFTWFQNEWKENRVPKRNLLQQMLHEEVSMIYCLEHKTKNRTNRQEVFYKKAVKHFAKFTANTAHKMKFFIKDFFSTCDQSRRKMRIWSHLLKKSLMENFIFCAV